MIRPVFRMCVLASACLALAVSRVAAAPPAAPSTSPAAKSLDDELLQGLNSQLSKSIEDKPTAPPEKIAEPTKAAKKSESTDPLDEQLRESLEGGEDVGSSGEKEQNPLARIVVRMRLVQQRLAESKSDKLTQTEQQRISDELKALVEQMTQQQQQQSSSSSSDKQQTSRGKPKPGNSPAGKAPPGDPNKDPSKGSSSKVRPSHADRPDAAATREAVKKELDRLHLPDKDREEMLQAPPDEFLPGHESSIEQYFQRLIEQEEK